MTSVLTKSGIRVVTDATASYIAEHRKGEVQREALLAVHTLQTTRQLRRWCTTNDNHRWLVLSRHGCGNCAVCNKLINILKGNIN